VVEPLGHAGARRAVAADVVDLQAAPATDGLRDREQRLAGGRRRRRRLAQEADLVAQTLDPLCEPLRQDAGDLRQRLAGRDPSPLGDHEADRHRGRLVVGEHQRRQPGPGAQPVAAPDPGLAVDGDADVVEGDGVAANRPLGHAQVGRGRTSVHDRAALQKLEKREQSGGRTRDVWIQPRLRTKSVLNSS